MNTKALLGISFLLICNNLLSAGDALIDQANNLPTDELAVKIVQHGIFQKAELPTGNVLISDTNIIPAKVGVMFGMRFEISNVNLKDGELLKLTRIISHPQITYPNGEVSLGSVVNEYDPVRHNTVIHQVGYVFKNSYELVPGIWSFEMQLGGKTLVKQEFIVVKE